MSYTKFTSRHRKAVEIICNENDIDIVTTAIQKKNGTIAIHDNITDTGYTLHTTGYVRAKDDNGYIFTTRTWQLNRTAKDKNGWTIRILASADEQIVILMNAIQRHRKQNVISKLKKDIEILQSLVNEL